MTRIGDAPVSVGAILFVKKSRNPIGTRLLPEKDFVCEVTNKFAPCQFGQLQRGKKFLRDEKRAAIVAALTSVVPRPFGQPMANHAIRIGKHLRTLRLQLHKRELNLGVVSRAHHAFIPGVQAVVRPAIVVRAAVAAWMIFKPPMLLIVAVELGWRRSSGTILIDLALSGDHLVEEAVAPADFFAGRFAETGVAFLMMCTSASTLPCVSASHLRKSPASCHPPVEGQ